MLEAAAQILEVLGWFVHHPTTCVVTLLLVISQIPFLVLVFRQTSNIRKVIGMRKGDKWWRLEPPRYGGGSPRKQHRDDGRHPPFSDTDVTPKEPRP